MHTFKFSFLVLGALGALVGCQTDGSIGADGLVSGLTAVDEGATRPAAADLMVVWTVNSGSPDYNYIAGRGQLTDAGFEVELPSPMPAEAVNSYGVGVGVVVAMTPGGALPDGRLSDSLDPAVLVGAAPRYAIIYRDPAATVSSGEGDWMNLFPVGFSCGVGVAAPPSETFDSYTPVACDTMELRIGDVSTFDFVNWT